jgi:sortase A
MKRTTNVARMVAGAALLVAGAAAALYPWMTDLGFDFAQRALAAEVPAAKAPSAEAAQAGAIRLPAGCVARILIARIALDAYVVEGTGTKDLQRGPGHYPETPLPGEHGNSAIAGHRTTHGHVFRRLDELVVGDEIVTYTAARRAVYKVVSVRPVTPEDVGVVDPVDGYRLTLTTCHPEGSAKQRLIVTAEMVR